MLYTREKLDEIKSKINFFDFYKKYLPDLKNTGSNRAFALCPFHNENRPSFSIDTQYGLWRCWGSCNTGGDVFSFYKRFFNVSFGEAVEAIAKLYDVTIELSPEEEEKYKVKKSLYDINKLMCEKFQLSLKGNNEAYNYLTKIRGLSPKIIEDFKIGCGINKLPFKDSLKRLGLIVPDLNNNYHAKFKNDRVIFPRIDEYGNILSFTGRLYVDSDNYKYMHTSNTEIYEKSQFIFGLYQAKKYIKNFNSVILVEGNIDVIKCHQKGIVNAVCLDGLNISDCQVNMLKKYTDKFYYCLEDDAPLRPDTKGLTSLDKLVATIKSNIPYAKVYIIDLRNKDGSKCDADMYLTNHTREDFNNLIKHSKIYNEFLIDLKLKNINPKNIEEKTSCLNFLVPILANISNFMDRKQYIELVANKLIISENDIYKKIKWHTEKQEDIVKKDIHYDSRPVFAQKILLATCFSPIFSNNRAVELIRLKAINYMDSFYKNIFLELIYPYIKSFQSQKIDFTNFFSNLLYNDEVNEVVKKVLLDIYMKVDNFEDLDSKDLDKLFFEQVETLKEYCICDNNIKNF